MVRVVGSHHFAVTGQVVPIMYPYSKRHNPEHRTTLSWHRRSDDNFTNQQAEDNKRTNKKFSNIPHLDQLDRMVIDADSAQRAVEAVKYIPKTEANVGCSKQEESDNFEHNTNNQSEIIDSGNIANDQNTDIDSNDVEMFDSTCSKECGNLDFDDRWRGDECDAPSRKRHLTGDTESDSTETQTTDGCSVKKDRRRQRNKLSARAYRDRKRTKDQEQFQTLANLEAEQRYLLESVRKLQEEKRQFLQYLKTERNIDMPYEESDVTCTLASMS